MRCTRALLCKGASSQHDPAVSTVFAVRVALARDLQAQPRHADQLHRCTMLCWVMFWTDGEE